MHVSARVTAALGHQPNVRRVELVGSRGRGDATALSDWDFQIGTPNSPALARELPALVRPLEPLAAQWDRLAERATYMLVLAGAIKVDLFPGDERREIEPPWQPAPSNLAAIDAHFWDWVLWLGSKILRGRPDLVDEELHKLHRHLLGPLRVAASPATIEDAITEYCSARDELEREWTVSLGRRLSDDVTVALTRHGVIGNP
jgi:predicted nucleotidyltransferase